MKFWRTRESERIEFRADFDNLRNHPVFNAPGGTSYGASNFGQITGTRSGIGARQVQLSLKYFF